MKIKITLTIIFCFISILPAQQNKPTTSDISIEVITETIQITNKPQIILIRITCSSITDLQYLSMKYTNSSANWSLISALLNGESLWLLQSDSASDNDKVLAWNSNKNESNFLLYPSDWQTIFTLDLEIQINLMNISSLTIDSQDQIILDAIYNCITYECITSGRGNTIIFK